MDIQTVISKVKRDNYFLFYPKTGMLQHKKHNKHLSKQESKKETAIFLTSGIVHEIRNPLSNINMSVEMLKLSIENKELHLYLDIILRNAARINTQITELLIKAVAVEAKEDSLRQLMDEVINMTEDRIKLKNITVTRNYDVDDCKILMKKPEMKIAITNIVVNAIDAMTFGVGELKLSTKCTSDAYIIEIADNGSGISNEDMSNIFQPYFTKKPTGLGIGLATTYKILLANNVGISVESEQPGGTRFILSFDKNSSN